MAAVGADDREFVVLLEDLDASGCRVSDGTWGIERDGAAQALEDLADMHVRYEVPGAGRPPRPDGCLDTRLEVHTPPTVSGMRSITTVIESAMSSRRSARSTSRTVVHDVWTGPDVTIVHGDTHIGNVFLDASASGSTTGVSSTWTNPSAM